MNAAASDSFKPRWWVPGDWNAFFGLFTNVLLNVIVLTTLCLFVIKMPDDIVFGRILPALGIALPIGNLYYAYLAWRLAKTEGRSDVAAMPYGPSVPHMFIVVFVIMLPVLIKTGDVITAWQADNKTTGNWHVWGMVGMSGQVDVDVVQQRRRRRR